MVNLVRYFTDHPDIRVCCILSDRTDAPVLKEAATLEVPHKAFTRTEFRQADPVLDYLGACRADWIILAGFLSLLPGAFVHAFPGRILNIHPALLPAFGGHGMYGMRVHRAVIESGAGKSGITIHLVNDRYDEGRIVFQQEVTVEPGETPESLMHKVRSLELEHFPKVIEQLVRAT